MAGLKPTSKVKVEQYLQTVGEGGTTVLEIANATGCSESMVRVSVNALEQEGRARRKGGHNTVPDIWWPKARQLARPEYNTCKSSDGDKWEVLRRPAGASSAITRVATYELEAAAVEVAHTLNGWAGRER